MSDSRKRDRNDDERESSRGPKFTPPKQKQPKAEVKRAVPPPFPKMEASDEGPVATLASNVEIEAVANLYATDPPPVILDPEEPLVQNVTEEPIQGELSDVTPLPLPQEPEVENEADAQKFTIRAVPYPSRRPDMAEVEPATSEASEVVEPDLKPAEVAIEELAPTPAEATPEAPPVAEPVAEVKKDDSPKPPVEAQPVPEDKKPVANSAPPVKEPATAKQTSAAQAMFSPRTEKADPNKKWRRIVLITIISMPWLFTLVFLAFPTILKAPEAETVCFSAADPENLANFMEQETPSKFFGKPGKFDPSRKSFKCDVEPKMSGDYADVSACQICIPAKYAKSVWYPMTPEILKVFTSQADPTCYKNAGSPFLKQLSSKMEINHCGAMSHSAARKCFDYSQCELFVPEYK